MTPSALEERLSDFPRVSLGVQSTPLEPLARLTSRLGGPQLWIKRDDVIGHAMGGNKSRPLEFLLGDAIHCGRRPVVTFGGLQSNHARMTAAACAQLDIETHLYFFASQPQALRGNLMIDQLCGARLRFIPIAGGEASMTLETTNRLVRLLTWFLSGPRRYFIPVGGHNAIGCLGYVAAAAELARQLDRAGLPGERTTIVTATGTGVTLVGLVTGFGMLGCPVRVLGLDIGRLWKAFPASLARLATAVRQALGGERDLETGPLPLLPQHYAGSGYAIHSAKAQRAISLLAQTEGILLDPIYTGKAFAGVLDLVRAGQFEDNEHVVFLHTGGHPGLWAFEEQWSSVAASGSAAGTNNPSAKRSSTVPH